MLIPPNKDHRYDHYRKALRAVLDEMLAKGYAADACLVNTGFSASDVDDDNLHINLEQQYRLYRNILVLRKNSTVGLELGKAFRIETYGLLGYALLSSETLADAIKTTADFSSLTFSHFLISQIDEGNLSGIAFTPHTPLPKDLIQVYSDQDTSAALTALQTILPDDVQLSLIRLIHDDERHRKIYEDFFNCDIEFSCPRNELLVNKKYAVRKLPRRDKQATDYCREQCQHLLNRFDETEATADKVRAILVSDPGYFPSLEAVAEELNLGVRTLRRMLSKEKTSFQYLLQEIKRELAEQYLLSNMSLEVIASKLGYSEAANFSHAFKRWSGVSPKAFRQSQL